MSAEFWNIFRETGEPMCYLLCKADESRERSPEIKPIPEEFKTNPAPQPAPMSPR